MPGKVVTETRKDNYVDNNGDKATVPAGFSIDETENIISKGLVVHGSDKANGDNGSEFVWVPVPDINSMAQCSTAGGECNLQLESGILKCKTHNNEEIVGKLYATTHDGESFGVINTEYNPNNGLREPAYLSNLGCGDESIHNTIGLTFSNMQKDYKNMVTSVIKYGGFYVGRYETSLSNATINEAKDGEIQSKAGVIPTSANNTATYTWYGLYKAQYKTYKGMNDSVESSMIWGSQYDRILNWVEEGENETEKDKIKNTSLGNTSNKTIETTGNNKNSEDNIKNIRDLGGNIYEWTLEAWNDGVRVGRGGSYGHEHSPSFRHIQRPDETFSDDGSRMTLYIK